MDVHIENKTNVLAHDIFTMLAQSGSIGDLLSQC